MREAGHDVVYAGERPTDPGDLALLTEATSQARVLRVARARIYALPGACASSLARRFS